MNPVMMTEALKDVVGDHGFKPIGFEEPTLAFESNVAALENLFSQWRGTGWVARQSGVSVVLDGSGDNASDGHPVAAELYESATVTHQIRRAMGGWNITTLTEHDGATHLADLVRHIALESRVATYRRYWSLPSDGATEIVGWRLIGLEDLRP